MMQTDSNRTLGWWVAMHLAAALLVPRDLHGGAHALGGGVIGAPFTEGS